MAIRRSLILLSFLSFSSIFTIWSLWRHLSLRAAVTMHDSNIGHLRSENRLQIAPLNTATITDRTVHYIESINYSMNNTTVSQNSSVSMLTSENRTLHILMWNSKNPSWQKTVCLTETRQFKKCCEYTINRRAYSQSDAVLFYGDLMHLDHFPARLGSAASDGNRSRVIVKQKWIYMSVETPINTIHTGIKQIRLQRQRFLYNLTSTYSLKSDIPTPYHHGSCTDVIQGPSTLLETDTLNRLISRKTHQVAWFVSHCVTSSRREQYVRHLQRYIGVDIYGACGRHQCLRHTHSSPYPNTGSPHPNHTDYYTLCDDMVANKYKFYLAFENSLCADYVTEKFFRFLHRDVIVVALGAADYGRFVATGTYIDVRNYSSPRHLANHLVTLSERNDLYWEYLWRKRRLRCNGSGKRNERERRMCGYLYDNEDKVEMADLAVATDARRVCTSAGAFYRNVDDAITH